MTFLYQTYVARTSIGDYHHRCRMLHAQSHHYQSASVTKRLWSDRYVEYPRGLTNGYPSVSQSIASHHLD